MNELSTTEIQCPYCWQEFEIVIDCSVSHQTYIEDCEVCCRPIHLEVTVTAQGDIYVNANHEDA